MLQLKREVLARPQVGHVHEDVLSAPRFLEPIEQPAGVSGAVVAAIADEYVVQDFAPRTQAVPMLCAMCQLSRHARIISANTVISRNRALKVGDELRAHSTACPKPRHSRPWGSSAVGREEPLAVRLLEPHPVQSAPGARSPRQCRAHVVDPAADTGLQDHCRIPSRQRARDTDRVPPDRRAVSQAQLGLDRRKGCAATRGSVQVKPSNLESTAGLTVIEPGSPY